MNYIDCIDCINKSEDALLKKVEKSLYNLLKDCLNHDKNDKEDDKKSLIFNRPLGIAVSGGPDSTFLLLALSKISKKYKTPLKVITVDHAIRADSGQDAQFVKRLCTQLKDSGLNIECTIEKLAAGAVSECKRMRRGGLEDAARYLRYEAFKKFGKEKGLDYLLLAHNKDDYLETALIHFLEGVPATGIKAVRVIPLDEKTLTILRPMMGIEKKEIIDFLEKARVPYCNDYTNKNENYLRNRVRHTLIPLLDKSFCGWKNGVLSGAKRNEIDEEYFSLKCNNLIKSEKIFKNNNFFEGGEGLSIIEFRKDIIKKLSMSISTRLILRAAGQVAKKDIRFPRKRVIDALTALKKEKEYRTDALGVEIGFEHNLFFVKEKVKSEAKISYFLIITKEGRYDAPFGNILITKGKKEEGVLVTLTRRASKKIKLNNYDSNADNLNGKCFSIEGAPLPLAIRSAAPTDKIEYELGKNKRAQDFIKELGVDKSFFTLTPVLVRLSDEKIIAVAGGLFGGRDFILKEDAGSIKAQ